MKKSIVIGFAVLALTTSGVLAAKKPKAAAAPAATTASGPGLPPGSAADLALYKKNKRAAGIK
jgi:hypothetical protein